MKSDGKYPLGIDLHTEEAGPSHVENITCWTFLFPQNSGVRVFNKNGPPVNWSPHGPHKTQPSPHKVSIPSKVEPFTKFINSDLSHFYSKNYVVDALIIEIK